MITKVAYEVWHCDACGTVWLPRRGGSWERPDRCPNRGCRKLGGWVAANGSVVFKAQAGKVKVGESASREADEGGIQEHGGGLGDASDRMGERDTEVAEKDRKTDDGGNAVNPDRGRPQIRVNAGWKRVAVPAAKAKGQLSAEEFMSMSSSEQLRARREGKF